MERATLEKSLSLVLGRNVNLRSPEIPLLTPGDLKRAFYRRAHEFHPDKAVSRGLDPDFMASQFITIQNAYALILESWDSGEFAALLSAPDSGVRNSMAGTWRSAAQGASCRTADGATTGRRYTARGDETAYARDSGWQNKNAYTTRPQGRYHTGPVPGMELRFAQYLYYNRLIDWDTLIGALSWQYRNRPRIGDIGVDIGYMGFPDILAVLKNKKANERFGETAIRLGLLSPGKLSVLIGHQKRLGMPIGRYFTERGLLREEDVARTLQEQFNHNWRVRMRCKLAQNETIRSAPHAAGSR